MRRRSLGLSILFMQVLSFGLLAQEPMPPPRPLIWQPPTPEQISTYKNSKYGFSVDLPGTPTVSEGTPDRPNVLNFYSVKRPGSLTSIRVIDFTEEDLKKASNKEIIRQVKAAYSQGSFKIGSIFAETEDRVDFTSLDGLTFRRISAQFVNGKLFELYIDVTNWHLLTKSYPEIAAKFDIEANRFFKSFQLAR